MMRKFLCVNLLCAQMDTGMKPVLLSFEFQWLFIKQPLCLLGDVTPKHIMLITVDFNNVNLPLLLMNSQILSADGTVPSAERENYIVSFCGKSMDNSKRN